MKFVIVGKNIEVTPGLRSAVEEKIGKLERYFNPETEAHVTLSVEKERQKIEVTIPDEYMGDVMGDMNARRGRIEGMEAKGNAQIIRGFVPLSEMFGYATDLRSKTQGRGLYTLQSDHFEEVPKSVSEEIIAKRRG